MPELSPHASGSCPVSCLLLAKPSAVMLAKLPFVPHSAGSCGQSECCLCRFAAKESQLAEEVLRRLAIRACYMQINPATNIKHACNMHAGQHRHMIDHRY